MSAKTRRGPLCFRSIGLEAIALAAVLVLSLAAPARARERILLVGDSWARQLWYQRSFDNALKAFGIYDVQGVGKETTMGGTTAAQWSTAEYLQKIDAALAAHPTVDVVHLSLGGNDVIWYGMKYAQMTLPQRDAAFDAVAQNIRTVARHILDGYPGVHVVLGDYDYPNLIDKTDWDRNYAWQAQTSGNWAFAQLEPRKKALAAEDPRIHYVNSLGLMQLLFGDPARGIPKQAAPWPLGYRFLPSPASLMADGLHLSPKGYYHLAWWHSMVFYAQYFRDHP